MLVLFCMGQFLFAGAETGFVSWSGFKLAYRAGQGDLLARWAVFLMDRKSALLSAVLIATNVCVVGATLAFLDVYRRLDAIVTLDLQRLPAPESFILAPAMVVLCEMVPKSLFRIYSFRLTIRAIPVLMASYILTWPATKLFSAAVSVVKREERSERSFRAKKREEMVLVAMEGARRGVLFGGADVSVRSVLALRDRTVGDFISGGAGTPASETFSVDAGMTAGEACRRLGEGDVDEAVVTAHQDGEFVGWVRLADLLRADPAGTLRRFVRPLPSVRAGESLLSCLQSDEPDFRRFFLVCDREGHAAGVVDRMELFRRVFEGVA
jgi:CBS domain containing-hemolysin-like protein